MGDIHNNWRGGPTDWEWRAHFCDHSGWNVSFSRIFDLIQSTKYSDSIVNCSLLKILRLLVWEEHSRREEDEMCVFVFQIFVVFHIIGISENKSDAFWGHSSFERRSSEVPARSGIYLRNSLRIEFIPILQRRLWYLLHLRRWLVLLSQE